MVNLKLQVLWLKDSLGLCVNYKTPERLLPLTPYYFWPVNEAWEQIKAELDSKTWINNEDRIKFLNIVGEVMNDWQQSRTNVNSKQPNMETKLLLEDVFIIGIP